MRRGYGKPSGGSLSGGGRDERDWVNDDIAFFMPVNLTS
jgi:hypothetical protein